MKNWYIESADEAVSAFSSDKENGLCEEKARELLSVYGKNKLREKEKPSVSQRFFSQLKNITVILLLIAAFVSFVVEVVESHGEKINFIEPLIILLVVAGNAALAVIRETKADSVISSLQKLNSRRSKVRRDGEAKTIPSEEIVPGDIVLLEAGDIIPADGRLLKCSELTCSENPLIGENTPSTKNADAHIDVTCPINDRVNMVYSGGCVTGGQGEFVVTATGMKTEIGNIAGMIANEESQHTPLQRQLIRLARFLSIVSIAVCAFIFIFGTFATSDWLNTFLIAAALAVAAIPEVIVSIVVAALSLGAQRMHRKNILVKNLAAVDISGSTSVICSDKTGTLTQSKMTLSRVWSYEDNALRNLTDLDPSSDKSVVKVIQLAALCSDTGASSEKNDDPSYFENPVEAAFVSALLSLGQEKSELEKIYKRISEIPFDAERRLMTTVHSTDSGYISITNGAPDILLARCAGADTQRIMAVCDSMTRDSLRVIAIAGKKLLRKPSEIDESLENALTFIGLAGIAEPPRDFTSSAVKLCHEAGIRTVMMTGDHISTATAIAKDLGILSSGEQAITGEQLSPMSDAELCSSIRKYSVYSRVTAADKLRIIKAWQDAGEVVAITGDTVSDASALKAADIGCSMGASGTDVARNAADLVVTDDDFSSIVDAIHEGRGVFDSIKKSLQYLFSCNVGAIFAVLGCMLFFDRSPLAAMHILLINFLTHSFPSFALGIERKDSEIMHRQPRSKDEPIISRSTAAVTIVQGIIIGLMTIIAYAIGFSLSKGDLGVSSAMAFGTLSFSQLTHILAIRREGTIFTKAFIENKVMLYSVLCSAVITFLILLIPGLAGIFSLSSPSPIMWLWIIVLSHVPIIFNEILNMLKNLYARYTVQ